MNLNVPVVTIDGPSGVGKGTISTRLADHLRWHYLDSGAIYRIAAFAALEKNIALDDQQSLSEMTKQLVIRFKSNGQVLLDNKDVSANIREEKTGLAASQIAVHAQLREVLLFKQLEFQKSPGLVADGRDMGTTVFPFSKCKIYLTASSQERAKRRYKQLIDNESSAKIEHFSESINMDEILKQIEERDHRDMNRISSPLKPATDAIIIDTSELSIGDVFQQVLSASIQKIDSIIE